MTDTVYTTVLNTIKSRYHPTTAFTPRQVFEQSTTFRDASSSEFTNAFNALKNNGLIMETNPGKTYMSNWSVEYCLAEPKQVTTVNSQLQEIAKKQTEKTSAITFNVDNLIKTVYEKENSKKASSEVTEKVAEQTEKGHILNDLVKVVNELNQLYARIEKLQTPNNFDISKFSSKELLQELSRREV